MTTLTEPATGRPWQEVPATALDSIDEVFERAAAAQKQWAALPATMRSELLFGLADRLGQLTEELAEIEARNTGKSIRETRQEAARMPAAVRYWAGWADKVTGTTVPFHPDFHTYTTREPWGVVVGIVPWNVPYIFAVRRIVPAIALGNAVILKPAEETPLTALRLAEACREAGIPDGLVQVVTGGADVGAALVEHPGADIILFTGFHETGKAIARAAANNLTPTLQELGGKSPQIIFPDADLDQALDAVVAGVFGATGQMCIAGSRLLLHDDVPDSFLEELASRVNQLVVGDPRDESTDVGPQVTARQRDKTLAMIEAATSEGARIAAQAQLPADPELADGFFTQPTVFTDVTPEMSIATQEVFGPVLSVMRFSDETEAIRLANDTEFGLAAGVWTSDVGRMHRMARSIKAGLIWGNTYRIINDMIPTAGYGQSGYGAEGGMESIASLTRSKSVCLALEPGLPSYIPRLPKANQS
ncbi:aldehyde dehydrogenase family protein [Gephyromycinifex aptenodytis]|uniref:aldehyde dehydrogenase family protein n=1 Tax=Gephyromycinifex aptenodytis TaxID=2716227 RepID=UPI0014486C62|nr:aldehyde dehydrogenase family protein [Gephyromycinifex aptenodytis]